MTSVMVQLITSPIKIVDIANITRWLGDRMMHQPLYGFWKIAEFYKTSDLVDSTSAIVDIEQIDLHTWTYTKELV
jgi:hypothetical protein